MLLAVRILSYGCTWEVWRALKKLELHSAGAPNENIVQNHLHIALVNVF